MSWGGWVWYKLCSSCFVTAAFAGVGGEWGGEPQELLVPRLHRRRQRKAGVQPLRQEVRPHRLRQRLLLRALYSAADTGRRRDFVPLWQSCPLLLHFLSDHSLPCLCVHILSIKTISKLTEPSKIHKNVSSLCAAYQERNMLAGWKVGASKKVLW